jgi:Kef-type K+ transport system membrane component KefB
MFHLIHSQLPFIVVLLIVLLGAKVLGEIMERFGQPSMIGEVLAGVIVGPSLLNLVQNTDELKVIADLGVFMLIVIAGMEIDMDEIFHSIRGKNALIAVFGFVIPFLSGFAIGKFFHTNSTFAVILGLCIAITALPVSIRILMDLGKLSTEIGQRIISAAIFNDVLSLLILGVILDFSDESKRLRDIAFSTSLTIGKVCLFILFLSIVYGVVRIIKSRMGALSPKVLNFLHILRGKQSLLALVLVYVLAFASISEALGLHFIIGAFFGAILFPRSIFSRGGFERVKESTSSITMGFLAPIFFAFMGISFNFSSLSNIPLLLIVLAASFFSKIFGGYLGSRLAGFGNIHSLTLGFGLNARGIMELVIANIALQRGFIDITVFSVLVVMTLLTTLSTPFLLKWGFARIDRKEKKLGEVKTA